MAVDWSGAARGAERRIWVAEARAGELVALTPGLSREAAVAHVIAAEQVVAGFDFGFSLPAWFVRSLGCADVEALWARVAQDGEAWLAACEPPFWGRPGRPRPARDREEPELRRSEMLLAGSVPPEPVTSAPGPRPAPQTAPRPKSTFQIGGAGSVGTGSLRGMPFLPRLRAAGFALWPWEEVRAPVALEIYPRLLTGPVVKSSADARRAYLADDPRVPKALFAAAVGSEDAFDAAVSALAMAARLPELLALRATTDPAERLEGAIWPPPVGGST